VVWEHRCLWPCQVLLIIRKRLGRQGDPQGVDHGEHVDRFLRDGAGNFDHAAIDRTDLMREDYQEVADGYLVERDICNGTVQLAVCHRGHAPGQRFQDSSRLRS
jgi:hypothetical protein